MRADTVHDLIQRTKLHLLAHDRYFACKPTRTPVQQFDRWRIERRLVLGTVMCCPVIPLQQHVCRVVGSTEAGHEQGPLGCTSLHGFGSSFALWRQHSPCFLSKTAKTSQTGPGCTRSTHNTAAQRHSKAARHSKATTIKATT